MEITLTPKTLFNYYKNTVNLIDLILGIRINLKQILGNYNQLKTLIQERDMVKGI